MPAPRYLERSPSDRAGRSSHRGRRGCRGDRNGRRATVHSIQSHPAGDVRARRGRRQCSRKRDGARTRRRAANRALRRDAARNDHERRRLDGSDAAAGRRTLRRSSPARVAAGTGFARHRARTPRAVRRSAQPRRAERTCDRARARFRRAPRRRADSRRHRATASEPRCNAGARTHVGARPAARTVGRTGGIGRRRRTVGRAFGASARSSHRVSRSRHRARLGDGRTASWRRRRHRALANDRARAAALACMQRNGRRNLVVRSVERRPAARRSRRDDGNGRARRPRLRARGPLVEYARDCRACNRLRSPAERSHAFLRALVLVRRRDLCVRAAGRTIDRVARSASQPRARGARALYRHSNRRLAAGSGRVSAVHALFHRGELRHRSVRRGHDGARRRAGRPRVVRAARTGDRQRRILGCSRG